MIYPSNLSYTFVVLNNFGCSTTLSNHEHVVILAFTPFTLTPELNYFDKLHNFDLEFSKNMPFVYAYRTLERKYAGSVSIFQNDQSFTTVRTVPVING